jgi:hypothetical protein
MQRIFASVLTVSGLALGVACQSKGAPEPGASRDEPASASGQPAASPVAVASSKSAADGSKGDTMHEGAPRFGWGGPLSVRVNEKTKQQEHKFEFTYFLDVCPGAEGTTLVAHRDMQLSEFEGQAITGGQSPPMVRKLEAEVSMVPTMVIGAHGHFEHGSGYPALLKQLSASFPGENFSTLRKWIDTGQAPTMLDPTLAQLWQGWVGAWLHFDPARGVGQEIDSDADGGAGASRPKLFFDGFTTEHYVKLHGRFPLSRVELDQMVANTGGSADSVRNAELVWRVETDWPAIRPWRAHSQRTAVVKVDGQDTPVSEEHDYVFTWPAQGAKPPKCSPGA